MFSFIRSHWKAYLIGFVLAIALGLGAALFLGAKWSTPAEIRADHIKAESDRSSVIDEVAAAEGE